MNRKLRWLFIGMLVAAFAVWLEPTRVVWGWLRGEAFYEGRPSSWWATELTRWRALQVEPVWAGGNDGVGRLPARGATVVFVREKDDVDTWLRRWTGKPVLIKVNVNELQEEKGPRLLQGDDATEPVLRALANDPSESVRTLVNHGLRRLHEKRHPQEIP